MGERSVAAGGWDAVGVLTGSLVPRRVLGGAVLPGVVCPPRDDVALVVAAPDLLTTVLVGRALPLPVPGLGVLPHGVAVFSPVVPAVPVVRAVVLGVLPGTGVVLTGGRGRRRVSGGPDVTIEQGGSGVGGPAERILGHWGDSFDVGGSPLRRDGTRATPSWPASRAGPGPGPGTSRSGDEIDDRHRRYGDAVAIINVGDDRASASAVGVHRLLV
jgi:hypothetical protein